MTETDAPPQTLSAAALSKLDKKRKTVIYCIYGKQDL